MEKLKTGVDLDVFIANTPRGNRGVFNMRLYHRRVVNLFLSEVLQSFKAGKITKETALEKIQESIDYAANPYKNKSHNRDTEADKS